MKKIVAILLGLSMMLSLVGVMAAEQHPVGGEIIYGSNTEISGDWAQDAYWTNNATDNIHLTTGSNRLNTAPHRLMGAFYKKAVFFAGFSSKKCCVRVAVYAVLKCGDVNVDDIAFLNHCGIWNTMAHNLIE